MIANITQMDSKKLVPSSTPDGSGVVHATYGKKHGYTTLRLRNFRKNELQVRITTTLGF